MGIKVPTAVEAGAGDAKATPLNTPTQQLATNDKMFGGGQADTALQAASAAEGASNALMGAAVKIRSREDTIIRTRARNAFYEKHFGEFNRMLSEDDLTDPDVVANYNKSLSEDMEKVLVEHRGSDDSKARLSAALEDMRTKFSTQAAAEAIKGQQALLDSHMQTQMRALVGQAQDPNIPLNDLFSEIDKHIDDVAPGLYPEQETQWSDLMRQNVIVAKVESFTNVGAFEEARDLIAENPFITDILSESQQLSLSKTITAGIRAKDAAFKDGLNIRAKLRGILGRTPSQMEVMQYAGLKVGEPYKPLSEQGKQAWDRQYLVSAYGEGSNQVKDFDASIQDNELTSQQKNFEAAQRDGFKGSFIDYVNATRTTLEKTPTGFEYDGEGNLQYIKGGPSDPNTKAYADKVKKYGSAKTALNSLIMQTQSVKERITDARKLISSYSTGWGSMLDKMPTSEARSLKNALATLEANITLDAIKALRASSPTGGALGQQSDAENRLLAATKGVLDPAQRDQLEANLDKLEKSSTEYLNHITEAFNTDFADFIGKEGAEMIQSASDKVTDTEFAMDASGQIIPRAGEAAPQAQASEAPHTAQPQFTLDELLDEKARREASKKADSGVK